MQQIKVNITFKYVPRTVEGQQFNHHISRFELREIIESAIENAQARMERAKFMPQEVYVNI